MIIVGAAFIIASVFCLIFSKTLKEHCTLKTSAVSFGLSAVGALGLICAFLWFSIVSFGDMAKHPIMYPVSIALGLFCLAVFVALILVYFKIRSKKPSVKGVIIDVLTSIVYLPVFFLVFSYIQSSIA